MSKGGGKTTTTTRPDDLTQSGREYLDARTRGVLGGPQYGGFQDSAYNLGSLGFNALAGDEEAFGAFMNPYQKQVIDRLRQGFAHAGSQALNMVDERAIKNGAFGGSRAGLASGQAAADVASRQADAEANFLYSGFNDAQARAAKAAGMGYDAWSGLQQLPGQMLNPVFQYGGQTQTTKQPGGSILGGIAGIGATIAGGPLGGAIASKLGFGGMPAAPNPGSLDPSYFAGLPQGGYTPPAPAPFDWASAGWAAPYKR